MVTRTRQGDVAIPTFRSAADVERSYRLRRDIRGIERDPEETRVRPCDVPDLYPRDRYPALAQLEVEMARLVGVGEEESLIAYSSGMSALIGALESIHPTAGTTILAGQVLYTEARTYLNEHLGTRGVKVFYVDSGNADELAKAMQVHSPDIVVFETVANGIEIPVLDINELFRSISSINAEKPLVVLDNTLPTPAIIPPGVTFGNGAARVVVVESGTKAYARNTDLLGVTYTNDRDLYTQLYTSSITTGSGPTRPSVDLIRQNLPASRQEFDERTRLIFRNTLRLANAVFSASIENPSLYVTHPNLPNHPNYTLAQEINADGITPVFYISNGGNQFALVDDGLFGNSVIREYCRIRQSFGFDETTIYPYHGYPSVRIAAGTESEEVAEEIADALYEQLKRA